MGLDDRLQNAAEQVGGRAKEAAGAIADDDQLRREGKAEQFSAKVKDTVEDVKDKAKDVLGDLKQKLD